MRIQWNDKNRNVILTRSLGSIILSARARANVKLCTRLQRMGVGLVDVVENITRGRVLYTKES